MSGRARRQTVAWLAVVVALVVCLPIAAFGSRGARTNADRVTSIAKSLKCPACLGESVQQSQAPIAQAIRAEIARQVQAGETSSAIRADLNSRFGNLDYTPPGTGVASLVWVLPVVALLVAIAGLAYVFRRWQREGRGAHASAEDVALVAAALAGDKPSAARNGRQ